MLQLLWFYTKKKKKKREQTNKQTHLYFLNSFVLKLKGHVYTYLYREGYIHRYIYIHTNIFVKGTSSSYLYDSFFVNFAAASAADSNYFSALFIEKQNNISLSPNDLEGRNSEDEFVKND